MLYLSQMLGKPVVDSTGEELGRISDLAISTGEVFPRITSLAFKGPAKVPFMISWRKYVEEFDGDKIQLNTQAHEVRFSYLQPDEILLARDLLNQQIVDTQGLKVVRVNDLKFSMSYNEQLRLLGAEVGTRGILRGISSHLETAVVKISELFKHPLQERIIAWNYMDLLDRDLSQVKLSVTHRRLHELHPADVADILEQLDPQQRGRVFEHLDNQQAAEAITELEDEFQADVIEDLPEGRASQLLAQMEPDDAADIIGDLPYDKAEKILWLMGVQDQKRIRKLLGYKETSAGGVMTTAFIALPEETTVAATVEHIRRTRDELESVHYVYVNDAAGLLVGAVSLRELVLADDDATLGALAFRELITADPDDDQEEVANNISKYDLLAMPVVDDGKLVGIVTVDDAFDVLEEEHDEDLQIAGATNFEDESDSAVVRVLKQILKRGLWFIIWAAAAFVVVLTDTMATFGGALLLLPIVLILADNASQFAVNDLLDYSGNDDEGTTFSSLLVRDIGAGIAVVAVVCVLLYVVGSAFLQAGSDVLTGVTVPLLNAVIPVAASCFVMMIASAVCTGVTRRRLDKGGEVSHAVILAALIVVGMLVLALGVLFFPAVA